MRTTKDIEVERLIQQARLDSEISRPVRNKMGQFATPPALAQEIIATSVKMLSSREKIRFIDPAFGTGSFFSALLHAVRPTRITEANGIEIDNRYGSVAEKLWSSNKLKLVHDDFFKVDPPGSESKRFNLLVCNPPYIRHHHLAPKSKEVLQALIARRHNIRLSGLAGLYCYYLLHAHEWLTEGGISCWLVPSEFMDVNYGREVKQYLSTRVTLLRIHRFHVDDVQFDDALVSSVVVWFKKSRPGMDCAFLYTSGGSLNSPKNSTEVRLTSLRPDAKWSRKLNPVKDTNTSRGGLVLSDFFQVKRGLATGSNGFFILSPDDIAARELPEKFMLPMLPSPRYLEGDEIEADEKGNPKIGKKLFLLDCDLPEAEVKKDYPSLWSYLKSGMKESIDKTYLCTHRSPWYSQEKRAPAPILCTYMGRSDGAGSRAFRFILNRSLARAANVYLLLYPKPTLLNAMGKDPELIQRIWERLNTISSERLIHSGRSYGGGLHKMEPRELAMMPADEILDLLPQQAIPPKGTPDLFASSL